MRHVIFGASGFTGRYLARALHEAGQAVVCCDLAEPLLQGPGVEAFRVDITDPASLSRVPLSSDDIVYHLAALQYHLPVPRTGRDAFFARVNVDGTRNILERMSAAGCERLIFFSTDMVYGIPQRVPVTPDHPHQPLGPYGRSKTKAESLCRDYRTRGISISVLRPRLIIGPGRLGVLAKLFRLIRAGMPVPLIGNGSNSYQMISVFDCVSAARAAADQGAPNGEFNLGSDAPPRVDDLLRSLIRRAGSRSILVPTPAPLVKATLGMLDGIGLSPMYREQFAIADLNCLVDISVTRSVLGWTPRFSDEDMLCEAYDEFVMGTK